MIFFASVIVKPMEKNLDITKPLYGKQILPVPWPFVISRLYCTLFVNQSNITPSAEHVRWKFYLKKVTKEYYNQVIHNGIYTLLFTGV